MSQDVPEWLNKEFLAQVLSSGGDAVTVSGFTATLAVAPGNNYTSHIWRVRIDYQSVLPDSQPQSTSLMVKAPITKGVMNDMAEKWDLFGKEPKVYCELLPLIADKTGRQFGPKCFPWPETTQETRGLILQDLKEEGYLMAERQRQLDFEHCSVALTSLAQFHAASVACVQDHPHLATDIGYELIYSKGTEMLEQFKPWFELIVTQVAERISHLDECKHVEEYFRSRNDGLLDSVVEIVNHEGNSLNVLNHGDFWATNMMFKHSESGKVIDVKFLDFQISRYTTPVVDLHYFIWSSANDEVRENRLDELFATYLKTFNSSLEKLGCSERMTEQELKDDLKRTSDFALLTICNLLPIVVCETENVIDMEQVTENDFKEAPNERWMKVYQGENYSKILPNAVRQFYKYFILQAKTLH